MVSDPFWLYTPYVSYSCKIGAILYDECDAEVLRN